MTGRGSDRGSATVCGIGMLAVLFLLIAFGVHLGGAVLLRHRVAAAADLAALAAATTLPDGEVEACTRARWVADRMGATVDSCTADGWNVTVEVSGALDVVGTTNARARAGPAEG
ncbi:MAG TPA: Rv3654c family TadE-like protein [Pseudonocardiaceae bacterium]|jgi:secretion/DNA translocation related TadE-like protein|nr:Rv3654c family TadE-like protein [Pseudonocardiaceae bacterium]